MKGESVKQEKGRKEGEGACIEFDTKHDELETCPSRIFYENLIGISSREDAAPGTGPVLKGELRKWKRVEPSRSLKG